ncbi:MAG: hypothetical protein ACR2N3_15710 [Pyrinomonadaceae bacterium]
MSIQISKILLTFVFLLLGTFYVHAQTPDASSADGRTGIDKEDYPDGIKENFAKQRIKAEEKEFNEMLGRSEEAAKISDELCKSFETNKKLLPEDAKKMERLEKLVKKIRDELGSESDDDKDGSPNNSPLSFTDALKNLQETSSGLFSELKKQGRFSISVAAVENSNALLKLVRFVRQNQN